MTLVAAVITILVAGSPAVVQHGYVETSACTHPPRLPRMEDEYHRPITYRIECGR